MIKNYFILFYFSWVCLSFLSASDCEEKAVLKDQILISPPTCIIHPTKINIYLSNKNSN